MNNLRYWFNSDTWAIHGPGPDNRCGSFPELALGVFADWVNEDHWHGPYATIGAAIDGALLFGTDIWLCRTCAVDVNFQ